MSPDYRDVTVPCNIAPLNFHYSGRGPFRTEFTVGKARKVFYGRNVCWNMDSWQRMLREAAGDSIRVRSNVAGEWAVAVSVDSIDSYLTYRLIEPDYEVWNRVEIRERTMDSFDERVLSDWKHTDNSCMNCHIHKGNRALFYLRGPKGGAILSSNDTVRKLNLRSPGMSSSTVYGDLHPSGRWGVFSTNSIYPALHTSGSRRMEVFDTASDLTIADFQENVMLNDPVCARVDRLETFPCFSADGTQIFFCVADTAALPRNVTDLHYSIAGIGFDPESGKLDGPVDIVWDAEAHEASACHPKASPDGRWLMFTTADYGTFPIWHRECDLCLLDLKDGSIVPMAGVNSDVSDTYHSWSSNSRWFVFASKRGDGMYGKPFICHIGEDGTCSRPFLLPQKDPYHYEKQLKSYNIPDLGTMPAPYDNVRTGLVRDEVEAENFLDGFTTDSPLR